MCNVAGFIGRRQAAPVLLEMLSRQEGLAGGFFSGICTLHDGELHMRKVEGSLEDLLRETDASELPGTIGIAHTRPDMGGGSGHAHPFVSHNKQVALIVNGHWGHYAPCSDRSALAAEIINQGGNFTSKINDPGPNIASPRPRLPDGQYIHGSDLACQLIAREVSQCGSVSDGMARAMAIFPSETVNLMLHTTTPDQINIARFNQPLTIARQDDETFLATTTMGFEVESPDWLSVFPASSTGAVTRNEIIVRPLSIEGKKCCYHLPYAAGHEIIERTLKHPEGAGIQDLKDATSHLWPNGCAPQKDFLVYEIVRSLVNDGKLTQKNISRTSIHSGRIGPHTRFFMKP